MLQELAAQSGSAGWAIGSMLFFLAAWVAVVVWVARRRPDEMKARARLPLDDDSGNVNVSVNRESGVSSQGGARVQDYIGGHDSE